MRKIIGLIALGAAAYLLYKYNKDKNKVIPSTIIPVDKNDKIVKDNIKQGAKLIEQANIGTNSVKDRYKNQNSVVYQERMRQMSEKLFSGDKQYVTLENLIPNRYGQYNNFYGNYNQPNREDTTDIISAERTQALYKRPNPLFNNTL